MKNSAFFKIVCIVLISAFMFSACEDKDSSENNVPSETDNQLFYSESIENDLLADEIFEDILFEVEDASFFTGLKGGNKCPEISVDRPEDAPFPRVITKDFGDHCTLQHGVKVSGIIQVTLTAQRNVPGSERIVTYDGFIRDGVEVSGTHSIVFEGPTDEGFLVFTVQGAVTLIKEDGATIVREIDKTRTKIAGIGTKQKMDEEWLIEGSASGIFANGDEYVVTIEQPIHIAKQCKWPLSGLRKLEVNGHVIVLDFGDDKCNPKATRTVDGGEPVEIILR